MNRFLGGLTFVLIMILAAPVVATLLACIAILGISAVVGALVTARLHLLRYCPDFVIRSVMFATYFWGELLSFTSIKEQLAANPRVPIELLFELVDDSNEKVRLAVVQNPECTPVILLRGLEDSSLRVSLEILKHNRVNLDILEEALLDRRVDVRIAAIKHKKMPNGRILELLFDNEESIRKAAAKKIKEDENGIRPKERRDN